MAHLLARLPLGVDTPYEGAIGDSVVFETDGSPELPDEIRADIVVLGNRYEFTTEQVMDRISKSCCVGLMGYDEPLQETI